MLNAPAGLHPAIAEIERLGLGKWHEESQYDLSLLSDERRIQVRDSAHYAPEDMVARYIAQMEASQFPGIVVTSDGWTVDGNTRLAALRARRVGFFPAIVLEAAYAGKTTTVKQKAELRALAMTLNANGGLQLTPKERREGVRDLIALDWKNEQIARAIGLKVTEIAAVKREVDASAKLSRVGLDPDLKGASLRALGNAAVLKLNDPPFKLLAELATDAGLNAGEIVAAAKDALTMGTEAQQVGVLDSMRTQLANRIRTVALTGTGKPPVSRQLRQHLGYVTKFAGREQELVEANPAVAPQHVAALQDAIAVLTAVLNLQ